MLYTRVSSKDQEREGFSIPAQLKLLKEYAVRHGFVVVQEYMDIETAKVSGRQNFGKMVQFIKKTPQVRTILVEKTDRLYRNIKDWIVLDVDDLGLEIHFVKEGFILSRESRSSEKFIHGIRVLQAKNYIDNLSEEVKKGMTEKARQGLWPSYAPLGYINVEKNGRRCIEPDPELAPYIRQLYEWYATGQYSLKSITRKAREEGLAYRKTRGRLHTSAIYKTLTNPIYYGYFKWDGAVYKGTHAPLINKSLFDRVQEVLHPKAGRLHRGKYQWAFQGILSCGHCGCALTAELKKGKYVYYHCTGYRGKCPEKYVREEVLDQQVVKILQSIQIPPDILIWILAALRQNQKDESQYHAEMVKALQSQHQKLQNRMEQMYVDKLDGKVSQDFYDQKSMDWLGEQEEILKKIDLHRTASRSYIQEGIRILELSQKAAQLYIQQESSEKRRLLQFVLSNSIWKEGRLIPVFKKPFDLIALSTSDQIKKWEEHLGKDADLDIWCAFVDAYRTFCIDSPLPVREIFESLRLRHG